MTPPETNETRLVTIHKIVTGNGDPRTGLSDRVTRLEVKLNILISSVGGLYAFLSGIALALAKGWL